MSGLTFHKTFSDFLRYVTAAGTQLFLSPNVARMGGNRCLKTERFAVQKFKKTYTADLKMPTLIQ